MSILPKVRVIDARIIQSFLSGSLHEQAEAQDGSDKGIRDDDYSIF